MLRRARLLPIPLLCLLTLGCKTSEIKNNDSFGLMDDVPSGSVQSGYGSGHGDSIGGGGAAPALDATHKTGSEAGR